MYCHFCGVPPTATRHSTWLTFTFTSTQQTSRPACPNIEVRFKPFIAITIGVLDHWASPPALILMGTSAPFNEPPGSPLSTGRSGVNSGGQRSQDHRLHNAPDCWLLMLRRALRGGVGLCVCMRLFVWLCEYLSVCACKLVRVLECASVSAARILTCLRVCSCMPSQCVRERRNLIGRTTVADETWWTAGSLSSCWWGFGGLSLRGEIQFPPPARRRCLDSLAWDWRGCVTLQITQSLRVCWESAFWSAACHDSTQEECSTAESCQSLCQPD